jgi:hypothetical protein
LVRVEDNGTAAGQGLIDLGSTRLPFFFSQSWGASSASPVPSGG